MKKFYSVKEVSKILGVSTNTVYKYIDDGQLSYKRIGRGRIKIPYSEIIPFLPPETVIKPINSDQTLDLEKKSTDGGPTTSISDESIVRAGEGDIVFYRLFRAFFLIGLGLIYFLIKIPPFTGIGLIQVDDKGILFNLIPVGLFVGGIFCLVRVLDRDKFARWDFAIHSYLTLVLSLVTYICLKEGRLGLLVFVFATLVMVISHFMRGFSIVGLETFKSRFLRYSLILAIIGGVVVIHEPLYFPLNFFQRSISQNKDLFSLIWFSTTIPFFVYFLSPKGRNSKFANIYIGFLAIITLIFSGFVVMKSTWDVSYLSYLTGTYGLVLVLWETMKVNLDYRKIVNLVLAFIWISASIILGIFAIYSSQEKIKQKIGSQIKNKAMTLSFEIESVFGSSRSLLVRYSTNFRLKEALKAKNSDLVREFAKEIYEKSSFARRIVVFNEEGIAVAAYPRNSLVEGTNFSSRDYYSKTKENLSSFTSSAFKGVTGVDVVIQTEPIFENNKFIGMIGFGYSLENLSNYLREKVGTDYDFFAKDLNGIVVVSNNKENIGESLDSVLDKNVKAQSEEILESNFIKYLGWEVYLKTLDSSSFEGSSDTAFIISLVLMVNSFLTAIVGIALSSRRGEGSKFSKGFDLLSRRALIGT